MSLSSWNKSLALKYRGNPGLLLVAAVAGALGTVILARTYIRPYYARMKRRKANEFAQFLIEEENRKFIQ